MTTQDLYEKLEDPYFQDNTQGSIFTNVYIFPYAIKKENEVFSEIIGFKKRLIRPSNNLDLLYIDIFQLMLDYLKTKNFGKRGPLLAYYQKKEQEGINMTDVITQKIYVDNHDFLKTLYDKINSFLEKNKTNEDGLKRSIILLYGFSQIYPYVRVNQLLSSFEEYNTGEQFKLVLCYPGDVTDTSFSLFGELKDNHAYRAQILS